MKIVFLRESMIKYLATLEDLNKDAEMMIEDSILFSEHSDTAHVTVVRLWMHVTPEDPTQSASFIADTKLMQKALVAIALATPELETPTPTHPFVILRGDGHEYQIRTIDPSAFKKVPAPTLEPKVTVTISSHSFHRAVTAIGGFGTEKKGSDVILDYKPGQFVMSNYDTDFGLARVVFSGEALVENADQPEARAIYPIDYMKIVAQALEKYDGTMTIKFSKNYPGIFSANSIETQLEFFVAPRIPGDSDK